MTTKKTAELYLKNNDIYILENHNNTIIVNNNDQGLLLLDNSLHIQKLLIVPQEAPIYSLYKKYDNSALILYLPDAHQIILINIETDEHYVVALPEAFYKEVLSPNYYWNDILILTTTSNDLYQLDFTSKTLHQISYDTAQKICPYFYDYWNIGNTYNVLTFYPDKESFIFQNNDNTLRFFNYQQNKQQPIITGFADGWHDVEYNNGLALFIHENKIELLYDNHKSILNPRANFIFLKAKFLDNNHFVVLSSNPSNYQESSLEVYEINKN